MLFIIVNGLLGKLPVTLYRGAFCFSEETGRNVENERKWVFNLPGIGAMAWWGVGKGGRVSVCVSDAENV